LREGRQDLVAETIAFIQQQNFRGVEVGVGDNRFACQPVISRQQQHEVKHNMQAKGFSQGQRLKTALARALVHEPRNILLDEPTNGLDVMAVRTLRALLLKLKATGRCILLSSHVMQEVAALCDDIVVIAGAKVVAELSRFLQRAAK